jgi:hypothetical protein
MTSPEPTPERWLYAGVRRSARGKRVTCWIAPEGRTLSFAERTASYVIGAAYTVKVTRQDDGSVTMIGDPQFSEANAAPQDQAAEWATADRIARTKLANAARERKAARQNALDEALEPLMAVARTYRNRTDLDALSAYVLGQIHSAWALAPGERAGK